jgi:hypothetical protein
MQDFVSGANAKLREELGKKQLELVLLLQNHKTDIVLGVPSALTDELKKKTNELLDVFNKILESNKPEELLAMITHILQATGAERDMYALLILVNSIFYLVNSVQSHLQRHGSVRV